MTALVVATTPGDHTLQRSSRPLRIATFTAPSVGLGLLAHAAAGGGPPSAGAMLGIVAAVTLTWALLTRRERILPTIVLAMTLVQLGMHVALPMGHEHLPPMGHEQMPPMAGDTLPVMPAMLLAHTGSVLALSWWLRRGEIAARRVIGRVWRRLVRSRVVPSPSDQLPLELPVAARSVARRRVLFRVVPVRGPPLTLTSPSFTAAQPAPGSGIS